MADVSLFTYNHQLNYDEAVRRLKHWVNTEPSPRQEDALRILIAILERDRDILYFEKE